MVPTTIAPFSVSGLRNSQRRILDVACSGDGHLMGGKMKNPPGEPDGVIFAGVGPGLV